MNASAGQRISLNQLPLGELGTVAAFASELLASRLMAMGILPGTKISVVRKAPFGGGWYVQADGISLALRTREVNSIVLR